MTTTIDTVRSDESEFTIGALRIDLQNRRTATERLEGKPGEFSVVLVACEKFGAYAGSRAVRLGVDDLDHVIVMLTEVREWIRKAGT